MRRVSWGALVFLGCLGPALAPDVPSPRVEVDRTPLVDEPFLPVLSPHRLAVTEDVALVSDPEGPNADGRWPAVHIVGLTGEAVVHTLTLPDGSNPGAVEINPTTGIGYVISRGGGGVYAIDLHERRLGAFTPTCRAPVDLAPQGLGLVVACRGGELVSVRHEQVIATKQTGRHLTAVAVTSDDTVVAGTAAGELLAPDAVTRPPDRSFDGKTVQVDHVRRLVQTTGGRVAALFQQHLSGELSTPALPGTTAPTAYGGSGALGRCVPSAAGAALGIARDHRIRGAQATASVLATDLAVSPDGRRLVVADSAGGFLEVVNDAMVDPASGVSCLFADAIQVAAQIGLQTAPPRFRLLVRSPLAVAFTPTAQLVVLEGRPDLRVRVLDRNNLATAREVPIRGRKMPRGFELFHQQPNALSAITCASCHPDGLSNGAVTTVQSQRRRVMPLAGRQVMGSPVHWDSKPFSEAVAVGTWEQKMGGAPLSASEDASLQAFVAQLRLPHRPTLEAAARAAGEAAFVKAQCATCHVPETGFSTNGTANVGQGLHKVPSLRGLSYSAPYMSDGCALTLGERFSYQACGGGDQHGRPSVLSSAELTALMGYLRSL